MRFSSEPIPVVCEPDALFQALVVHHDLRVYVTERGYVDVGRGSFDAILRLESVAHNAEGLIGAVGQFCNFAKKCTLMGGGEHWNDRPVNTTFYTVPAFAEVTKDIPALTAQPAKPFSVGNAVVVSGEAKIMSGVTIGDCAVIGASALATRDVPAFAIAAGMPARAARERVPPQMQAALQQVRWWDFDMVYLGNNLHRLQELAVDVTTAHVYRTPRPRLAIRATHARSGEVSSINLLGFVDQNGVRPLQEAPDGMRAYLGQLARPGPYYWLPDMWAA